MAHGLAASAGLATISALLFQPAATPIGGWPRSYASRKPRG